MVNRKMTADDALSLIRKLARQKGYKVRPMTDDQGRSRGKGSHALYQIVRADGSEVERFGLTGHPSQDMSWTMLRRTEERLAPVFGEKWMEKR